MSIEWSVKMTERDRPEIWDVMRGEEKMVSLSNPELAFSIVDDINKIKVEMPE